MDSSLISHTASTYTLPIITSLGLLIRFILYFSFALSLQRTIHLTAQSGYRSIFHCIWFFLLPIFCSFLITWHIIPPVFAGVNLQTFAGTITVIVLIGVLSAVIPVILGQALPQDKKAKQRIVCLIVCGCGYGITEFLFQVWKPSLSNTWVFGLGVFGFVCWIAYWVISLQFQTILAHKKYSS